MPLNRGRAALLAAASACALAGLYVGRGLQAQTPFTSRPSPLGWNEVAYIKAPNPGEGDQFGASVALSGDGNTLAVAAPMEANAVGTVYVFTRSAGTWSWQASLKASNGDPNDQFGSALAVSADGNTLAVAAVYEDGGAAGVNGNQKDNSVAESGAVYVFARTGGRWSQQAYLKASNPGDEGDGDTFGHSLALSEDGETLAAGAPSEDSSAGGINGNQADNGTGGSGAVYVFARRRGTWTQQAYVKSDRARTNALFGYSVALGNRGDTLTVGAYDEDGGKGAVHIFTRASGLWSQQGRVQASNAERGDSLGAALAVSSDGATIVGGALDEDSLLTGLNSGDQGASDQSTDTSAGAAYVFTRGTSAWEQQAYLKSTNAGREDWFGVHLGLSGDGATLAISAPNEDSAARGLNGRQDDDTAQEAGAVYVWSRSGTAWTFSDYVKGSNTKEFDEFGSAVSLSRDGRTMAIGARFQSGGARGVNGRDTGTSVPQSGGVYLFVR